MEMIQTLSQSNQRIRDLFIVFGASIILALSAWIAIPLPFTPVPISFTFQLTLFFAVVFGKRGALATTLYFLQGVIGLPVFSHGGAGLAWVLGPTGGYLIGWVISTWILASLVEKMEKKTPAKMFALMIFGEALVYFFGLSHLALIAGWEKALHYGLYPFIATDLLKLMFFQRVLERMR